MPRGRPKKQAEAPAPAQANGESISKLEAVRRSLEELGNDAMPAALKDHIQKTFGLSMSPNHISNCKTLLVTKGRKGKRRGRKPKAAAEAVQEVAAPAAVVAVTVRGGGITLDDIRAIKELSGRLGSARVRELVDLVAR